MPRLALAVALLALVALSTTLTYTGFLAVGELARLLDAGRIVTGLLLGIVFARLPWIREGKLRTVGLLPKPARRPLMVSLIALCLLSYLYRGEIVPVLFLSFAATFLLAYPRLRKAAIARMLAPFARSSAEQSRSRNADDGVIDVEFREKKD